MIESAFTLITDETVPYKNIALETLLLEKLPAHTAALYLWQNRRTVVIGRNQNAWQECRVADLEADGGFLARRLSGGGAVFHDLGNLNFTFILPIEDFDKDRQTSVILEAVRKAGVVARKSGRNDIEIDCGDDFPATPIFSREMPRFNTAHSLYTPIWTRRRAIFPRPKTNSRQRA